MSEEEDIIFSFSVTPEIAKEIVDDIAEARANDQDKWTFDGWFEIENAIEIQANLQNQLREHELSEEYESYSTE